MTTIKPGAIYQIPEYVITKNGLVKTDIHEIHFVKGSREGDVSSQEGVITEDLLGVCLDFLKTVNTGDLANRQTTIAIEKLEEILALLEDRKRERIQAGVFQTYKPI